MNDDNFFDLSQTFNNDLLRQFARKLKQISNTIGFKVSARGWCYIMEQKRLINKDQFDRVEGLINKCRRKGFLPVDFVAEDDLRKFQGVVKKSDFTLEGLVRDNLRRVLEGHFFYEPDFFEGEKYYIQMVVEKIDLKTLFAPVCADYKIPIANAAGWSSILQRAQYARRFGVAEKRGMKCVLLYCGDFDVDGILISDKIRKNLEQVSGITWGDNTGGYDPRNLEIVRFGLNYDFIVRNNLTWIDNLITGSGLNLADPGHKNHFRPDVQKYLQKYGERKCEANAIVTMPTAARALCRAAIQEFLGADALQRFREKEEAVETQYEEILEKYELRGKINEIIKELGREEDEDENEEYFDEFESDEFQEYDEDEDEDEDDYYNEDEDED